jgi:alkylhydroperoxidase family enzyme
MFEENEVGGRLKQLFKSFSNPKTHKMDHILKIHSLDPPTLEYHVQLYRYLMFNPSQLSRAEKEMIAVAVSVQNKCHY